MGRKLRKLKLICCYSCLSLFLFSFSSIVYVISVVSSFTEANEDNGWTPIKYYDMLNVNRFTTESMRPDKSSVVDMINEYRAKHGVPNLVEDDTLTLKAQKCADFYALRGELRDNEPSTLRKVHRCLPNSESDFIFVGPKGDLAWLIFLRRWYREMYGSSTVSSQEDYENQLEVEPYIFPEPSLNLLPHYKHFTQMVWKASRRIGCARSKWTVGNEKNSKTYINLCLFKPKGNLVIDGSVIDYVNNVVPPTNGEGWVQRKQWRHEEDFY